MAARLWTALLVLAGVFVMHGAQCTAAAVDAGHTSPGAHSTVLAPTGTLMPSTSGAAVTVVPAAGIVPIGTVVADTVPTEHAATGSPTAVAVVEGPLRDSHGAAGQLWSVCLAVLAAALAVLLAVLVPHRRLVARHALPRVGPRLRSLSPPRPPDLSELCLLRI